MPLDNNGVTKVSTDNKGNFDTLLGYSISNIFQLEFYRSKNENVPQTTPQARTYANDGATNWRGSGKVVITSPLRGAPIWSALRIGVGRNMDIVNNTGQGYLFAETPLTWEANNEIAVNINPKVAWTGVGSIRMYNANIQIAPHLEIILRPTSLQTILKQAMQSICANAVDDIMKYMAALHFYYRYRPTLMPNKFAGVPG